MTALRTWLQQPLSRPWRQAALWAHVLSSSLWFGAVLAMMVLAVAKDRVPQSAAELRAFCVCVKLIDDLVIIATCGAAALSGLLLSWKTKWGFFVWWWVAVKLVVTLAMLAVGALWLGPWINEIEALARVDAAALPTLPRYVALNGRVLGIGGAQFVILGFVLYASVFKPWGKVRGRDTPGGAG